MLRGEPAAWANWLPGWGGSRLALTGALGTGWGEPAAAYAATGWLLLLGVAVVVVLRTTSGSRRPSRRPGTGRVSTPIEPRRRAASTTNERTLR